MRVAQRPTQVLLSPQIVGSVPLKKSAMTGIWTHNLRHHSPSSTICATTSAVSRHLKLVTRIYQFMIVQLQLVRVCGRVWKVLFSHSGHRTLYRVSGLCWESAQIQIGSNVSTTEKNQISQSCCSSFWKITKYFSFDCLIIIWVITIIVQQRKIKIQVWGLKKSFEFQLEWERKRKKAQWDFDLRTLLALSVSVNFFFFFSQRYF